MRALRFLTVIIVGAAACVDSTTASDSAAPGLWGSGQAALTVTDSGATLEILAGNCYGSYVDVHQRIPSRPFTIVATYTQLMGVYPGYVQYAATLTGTVERNVVTITVTVPDIERTVGPFTLAYGTGATFPRCLYP